jgi:excisionase family DNA binding protein
VPRKKLLSKNEAADCLSVSVRTLDRMRSLGQLRAVKVAGAVRFTEEEIERFIHRNTAKAVR